MIGNWAKRSSGMGHGAWGIGNCHNFRFEILDGLVIFIENRKSDIENRMGNLP
ncbi:MAG: hypothetical protein WBL95_09130 [Microcoleus sp.]